MIILIGNTKGGTGKSTIACNLAVESSAAGRSTLLVDADIQGSASCFSKLRTPRTFKSMYIPKPELHIKLPKLEYDLIIIDAGGRETKTFRSAMAACDTLIIPVTPSPLDIWATEDTVNLLKEIRRHKIVGAYFLLNLVKPRTRIERDAIEAISDFPDIKLLKTRLHSRVDYKNSLSLGLGVTEYNRWGKAAKEMRKLYKEIIG